MSIALPARFPDDLVFPLTTNQLFVIHVEGVRFCVQIDLVKDNRLLVSTLMLEDGLLIDSRDSVTDNDSAALDDELCDQFYEMLPKYLEYLRQNDHEQGCQ